MSGCRPDRAGRASGRSHDRRAFFGLAAAFAAAALGLVVAPPIAHAEPAPGARPAPRAARQRAVASAYGPGLYGRRTANGQILTAATVGLAHRTLPFGTLLEVSIPGRPAVRVRVIDRGPYGPGSTLDLTEATIQRMGFSSARAFGVRPVAWAYA